MFDSDIGMDNVSHVLCCLHVSGPRHMQFTVSPGMH